MPPRLSVSRFCRRILDGDEETPSRWIWFGVAMLYALVCAGLAFRQAFAGEYILADDVRQHVFWMFRFVDPRLFPNDPIADYFQSIAPPGFSFVYRMLALGGIDPLLASKLIPFAIGLITAAYFFGAARQLLGSPPAATLATALLCQALWLSSDLCSATPRAFFYPFFCAFLYYHLRNSRSAVLITILLLGLFFPPGALVSLGVIALDLLALRGFRPTLERKRSAYLFFIAACAAVLLPILFYLRGSEKFGVMISYSAARAMSEFAPGGRVPFFYHNFWDYWMHGAGGLHVQSRPSFLFAALLWPLLALFPNHFPLLQGFRPAQKPLLQITVSALSLFALSHLVLFRLYLPSRYTQHAARIVFAIAAAAVIMALLEAVLRWSAARSLRFGPLLVVVLLLGIVCHPLFLSRFPRAGYVQGHAANLYHFFSQQSPSIRIASIADEANNIPSFSRRSIIFGVETAVPFHPRYYLPLRDRGVTIARAQYSSDLAVIQQCIREQRIDFWLLDRGAFTAEHLHDNRALRQLRETIALSERAPPFLQHPPSKCVVFASPQFVVIDAHAVLALTHD
jgi:hypothetical protein